MHTFHDPELARLAEVATDLDASMALPDGAASVFAVATRVSVLDQYGYPAVGAATYATDQVLKATFTPVMETGVDLVQQNAAGDIIWHFKHGDMPKYWDVELDFATPDPTLESIICGGTLLTDSTVALTAPSSAPTASATTGGTTWAGGAFFYAYSLANQYGETTLSPYSTSTTIAANGKATLTLVPGTAKYINIYRGTASGAGQLLATIPAGTTFVDDGSYATPVGAPPTTNTSAGPTLAGGAPVGYQAPALGIVGNPDGFSFEFWSKAIVKGVQASYLPYYRWVVPMCKNFVQDAREASATGIANKYKGQAFENPVWGTGPFGDWQFSSTSVFQRARASAETVPAIGFASTPATA